jgi:hypothetical protein
MVVALLGESAAGAKTTCSVPPAHEREGLGGDQRRGGLRRLSDACHERETLAQRLGASWLAQSALFRTRSKPASACCTDAPGPA